MTRLVTACLVFLACLASLSAQDARHGVVFTKSIVGTLRVDGRSVGKHEVIDPVGKRFTTGPNCSAVIVLSNGMGIFIEENASLTFDAFEQELPDPNLKSEFESENSRSDLALTLDSGKVIFSQVKPWPTSSFVLRTPQGKLEGKVSQLAVDFSVIPHELLMLDGTLRFTSRSGRSITLQNGQRLDLDAAQHSAASQVVSEIEPPVEREYQEILTMTRRMRNMVVFTPENGTWESMVILTPESIDSMSYDEHYINY